MKNNRLRSGVFSVLLVLSAITALMYVCCGPSSSPTTRLTIGYTPVSGNLALFVAVEKGFFSKHGIDVKIQNFQNANLHTQALLASQIEGTATIPITTAFLVEPEQRRLIKFLAVNVYPRVNGADAIVSRKGSGVRTIADLRGKRIGIIPDVSALEFVKTMVSSELDPDKDVEIVQIPVQNQVDALASGQVDALWALEPLVTVAVERGVAQIVEDGAMAKHIHDPMVTAAFTLRSDFIENNPDQAASYKRALLEAATWIKQNPEEAKSILPSYTNISPELARKVRLVEYRDAREVIDSLRFLASWMQERGISDVVVEPEDLVF